MPQPVPISRDSNLSPWPSTATLLAAFAEFLRLEVAQGDAAPDTVQTYRRLVARYLAWCEATGQHPAQATPEEIKAYRWHLVEERGHRPATVALKLTVLRRFYQAAQAHGVLPHNPAAGVRAPRARIDPAERITYLDEAELARLLSAIPAGGTLKELRDRSLLALMALEGPRGVEMHRANVGDLFRQGDHWGLKVEGKGSLRTVPLRPDLAAVVQRYLAARQTAGEALGSEPVPDQIRDPEQAPGSSPGQVLAADCPLFVAVGNRAGGQRLSRRSIRRIVDGYLRKAGLKHCAGRTLSAHSLRHTAATLGLRAGASLRQVQDLLGHRDPKTTAIYAHIEDRFAHNPALGIAITL